MVADLVCLKSSAANANGMHEASELLHDTYRMLLAYYLPIHSHALHVYVSAIATMPKCALFATVSAEAARDVHLLSARAGGWTATLRVIEGHAGNVVSVAFSPDGTQLVSSSLDGTLRLWSARTGGTLAVLDCCTRRYSSVTFSSDGTQIVSVDSSRTIRLWDARSFETTAVLRPNTNHEHVTSVAYSQTKSLIVCSCDKTVCVWDLAADSQSFLEGHKTKVSKVVFSPDGTKVVSGSSDGIIHVWDSRTRAKLAVLEGGRKIRAVSFSFDGAWLIACSTGGTIHIWDMLTCKSIHVLRRRKWLVTSVAFSPDGQQVVFGAGDGRVRVWNGSLTRELAVLPGHLKHVTTVAFSPDSAEVASASKDGTIRIWDIQALESSEAAELGHVSLTPTDKIRILSFSPDGVYLVCTSGDYARVWDMQKISAIATLKGHKSRVTAIAFSPDGRRIVSGAGMGRVRVWDTQTGRQLAILKTNEGYVRAVAFVSDGRRVVSISRRTVQVCEWGLPSAERVAQIEGGTNQWSDIALSHNGLWIVSSLPDGAVGVWDMVTGAQIAQLKPHSDSAPATYIVFSSDDCWLHSKHGMHKLAWDFQDVLHRRTSSPHEVVCAAPTNSALIVKEGPSRIDCHTPAVISWNHLTGWLSCGAASDSKTSLPLCWLPVERRGPAAFHGWIVAVGGPDGNVTMLDMTDTIEDLQNLGIF
jgi:WD40 repeat protein